MAILGPVSTYVADVDYVTQETDYGRPPGKLGEKALAGPARWDVSRHLSEGVSAPPLVEFPPARFEGAAIAF
jgi:hypothetical protein